MFTWRCCELQVASVDDCVDLLRAGPKQHTGKQTCEFVHVDPQLVPYVFFLKCWILTQLAKRGVLDPVVHTFASELATHLGSHTDDVARHMGCG